MRGQYVKIEKEILLKTYEENNRSMNATAKVLNTSAKSIMRRMKEYGIEYDKKILYSCDENFFDNLNENSLYWLGFLATDGNVYKHNYSYTISLKLAAKDSEILVKFKNDIKSQAPIHNTITKPKSDKFKKKEYNGVQLTLTSEKIFNKLAEFNIVPNKTHTYTFPDQLKNHALVHHFIRGCIDGDGWYREHRNNGKAYTTEIRIGMCGTPIFVKEMYEIIKQKCNFDSGSYYERKFGKTADFEICSKKDANTLINYLYKDATIYLPRKYEIAMKAKQYK